MRLKAVGDAAGSDACVSRGEDIHRAVADEQGVFGRGAGFQHESVDADGVRFLMREAVAAVDGEEEVRERESVEDIATDANRLVGEDGHVEAQMGEGFERLANAGIGTSEIKLVQRVVLQEKLECSEHLLFGGLGSEGAAYEDRGAITHVGSDGFLGDRREAEASAGGVDGVGEVLTRVNESSIQVEDQKFWSKEDEGARSVSRHDGHAYELDPILQAGGEATQGVGGSRRGSEFIG